MRTDTALVVIDMQIGLIEPAYLFVERPLWAIM
jgi:nicotinamidase-related amidase